MQAMPAPMAARRPAVPNSILEAKHFLRASSAPSLTRFCTIAAVFGFWKDHPQNQKVFDVFGDSSHWCKEFPSNQLQPTLMTFCEIAHLLIVVTVDRELPGRELFTQMFVNSFFYESCLFFQQDHHWLLNGLWHKYLMQLLEN